MAKKIGVHYDHTQNEIQNAVIGNLTSDPAPATKGQIYYNTVGDILKLCTVGGGSPTWVPVGITYTGGAGLTLTGADFSVNVDNSTIEINSDTLRVKDGGITSAKITDGTIVNVDVNASAAIAYSKLNLASSIVSADIVDGTIVNVDVNASAAIAYSKLNLTGSIVNADVAAAAAIAYSKLATMATGSILLGNAGVPTATALSGDVTVGATGTTAIGANKVVSTMIAAAVAGGGLVGGAGTALAVGAGTGITVNADDVAVDTSVIATKAYADSVAQGLDAKASVRLATTAALPTNTRSTNTLTASASGALSVDGVAVAIGDRILVKNEATSANNGIYTVTLGGGAGQSYVLDRATDADTWTELPGAYVWVEIGTVNSDTGWVCTVDQGGTLNTTAVTFVQFASAATQIAGAGLTKTGNTIDVGQNANNSITVNADDVQTNDTVVPRLAIANTFTGTNAFTTGRFQSPTRAGGSPPASPVGGELYYNTTDNILYYYNSAIPQWVSTQGLPDSFSANLTGVATSYTVTHSLGTKDVVVQVYDTSTGAEVEIENLRSANTNDVVITFAVAPASNAYRVVIVSAGNGAIGDGSVTDAKLASPNNLTWKTVATAQGSFGTAAQANYFIGMAGTLSNLGTPGGGASAAGTVVQGTWDFAAADYAVAGLTTKFRVRIVIMASSGQGSAVFTGQLVQITSGALLGNVVTGSTAASSGTLAASTVYRFTSSEFAASALTDPSLYYLGLLISGAGATASGTIYLQLQTRNT